MAGRHYLLISDAIGPFVSGETPTGVMGLARALAGPGASATVLALASPAAVGASSGLARRLRTVAVSTSNGSEEVALFEGRAPLSQANLVAVAAQAASRAESAVLLAGAARSLGSDGLLKADVAIAWGESAALALSLVPAVVRLFVVPSGRVGGTLSPSETDIVLGAGIEATSGGTFSLAGFGAAFASAIVAPGVSSARMLEGERCFADRASDEPVIAVRFGCDDPPHDPATDPVLPANFSGKSLSGKSECRKFLTRRHSLAVGPKTLVLGCASLRSGKGGEEVLKALSSLEKLDLVTLVPGEGDPDLLARVRRLAVQSSGRLAVLEGGESQERLIRAAADAMLLADADDRTGRAAGLAQRYGALPIAYDGGASRDYLVDYDLASATGSAILYGSLDAREIESAVKRAVSLRASADRFGPLIQRTLDTAPRWSQTAAAFDEIASTFCQ